MLVDPDETPVYFGNDFRMGAPGQDEVEAAVSQLLQQFPEDVGGGSGRSSGGPSSSDGSPEPRTDIPAGSPSSASEVPDLVSSRFINGLVLTTAWVPSLPK